MPFHSNGANGDKCQIKFLKFNIVRADNAFVVHFSNGLAKKQEAE
jgi:hypothetical protein